MFAGASEGQALKTRTPGDVREEAESLEIHEAQEFRWI
jgi:hypothetical protein